MDRKDRIEKIESKKKEVDEKVKRSVGWSVIAVFSIVLGVFLILLPGDTAALVLQIAGIGFILKALAELYVGFRNRSLILATGKTISQIKEM